MHVCTCVESSTEDERVSIPFLVFTLLVIASIMICVVMVYKLLRAHSVNTSTDVLMHTSTRSAASNYELVNVQDGGHDDGDDFDLDSDMERNERRDSN